MANEQNLKRLSSKEARENGKKGGKASVAARRERKLLRDELLAMLSDSDTQEKMCLALVRQAQRGNTKAFEIVRDTIGEKPVERIETSKNAGDTALDIEVYMTARRATNAESDRT